MRYFILIAIILFPNLAFAACSEKGATVIYVNGIFTSLTDAQTDLGLLIEEYQKRTGDHETKFYNGYNPSHIEGYGDLYKSILQAYQNQESFVADTDLTTILLQIHPQVKTQKVVLVGHSQGTYYTNDMYKYLAGHGVSQNSIAVYNIATPASFVAGGGRHLTSATDKVINKVREALKHAPSVESFGAGAALATVPQTQPKDPLSSNTSFVLSPTEVADENGGHSFSNIYLENAPATIVSVISSDIAGLSSVADFNGDCFIAPSEGVSYKTGKATLGVMDFVAAKTGPSLAFLRDFAIDVGTKVPANLASAAGSFFNIFTPTPRTTNLPGSFSIVKALYGSSASNEAQLQELLGDSQGGAVALAVQEEPVPIPETKSDTQEGMVLGAETETPAAPAPAPDPAAQALYIPPLYPVGGGGSAGFGGGGGGGSASSEPVQEETAAADTTTTDIVATTTETAAATTTETVTETATTTETVTETATTTETVVETATSTTIAEQLNASVLGETNDAHIGNGNPTQKLGSGLSGLAGSVAYRLRGSDLASTTMGIPGGFGEVQLFACFSGSYVACNKRASSDFHPQILSQSGNDATMLVDMISSAYSFDPAQYYYLMWVTNGDMAVYGSAGDTYANGAAEWSDGSFAPDANISDVAFRICSTAQCVLP